MMQRTAQTGVRMTRLCMAALLVALAAVVVGVAGGSPASAATSAVPIATLDAASTDNYKWVWDDPSFDETRTSVLFRAVVVNGVRYTTSATPDEGGSPKNYDSVGGLPLVGPAGQSARLRPPATDPANARWRHFRVFASDAF